jgi:flagellar P-ring protein precursor FlgI
LSCRKLIAGCMLLATLASAQATPTVRIKDIATLKGVRENQLMGVGLVTGLAGRGDSASSQLLKNALANLVANFGFNVDADDIRSRNCAVVTVSCEVPPFLRAGERVNVRVSSIGDARSLQGGVLLQTALQAANGQSYAVAQGQILAVAGADAQRATTPTVGRIPGGAMVERDIISEFISDGTVSLLLRNPDFVTASSVAGAIRQAFPDIAVGSADAALIEVRIPEERIADPISFIAELESINVTPAASGKVVIDAATGIIIFGEQVRIGKVAVSYQGVKVSTTGYYQDRAADNGSRHVLVEETATVDQLVGILQEIGMETEIIIGLLRAIDRAGSLYGQLVVM